MIPQKTSNAHMDGREWVRRNVRGSRPSPVKIFKLNIGQGINQTKVSLRNSREAVRTGVELIRTLSQQALSQIMRLNKRVKVGVVPRATNKTDRSNKPKPSEAKSSCSSHGASRFDNSRGYSRSDNKANRDYVFKNAETTKSKSHLVISKIPGQGVEVPIAPPKVILKRKEIQISPLAHDEEVPFGSAQPRTLHSTIKAEEDSFDGDTSLYEDRL